MVVLAGGGSGDQSLRGCAVIDQSSYLIVPERNSELVHNVSTVPSTLIVNKTCCELSN